MNRKKANCVIYAIIHKKNAGILYVGSTTNLQNRIYFHKRFKFSKYGNQIEFVKIWVGLCTRRYAYHLEKSLGVLLTAIGNCGYNQTFYISSRAKSFQNKKWR